jgi:extradiol dioxygenase family protein
VNHPAEISPFHLAIPVNNLVVAAAFYETVLGCTRGRESADWVDLNFFGHQVVLHRINSGGVVDAAVNRVDSESIPVPHFGVVLDIAAFDALADRVRSAGEGFKLSPTTRFEGRVGEQRTFFLQDPCGNCLEFKAFAHPEMLFEKDLAFYE